MGPDPTPNSRAILRAVRPMFESLSQRTVTYWNWYRSSSFAGHSRMFNNFLGTKIQIREPGTGDPIAR